VVAVGCGEKREPLPPATATPTTTPERTVEGVPFRPAPAKVRAQCISTAKRTGIAVPCPTMLPADLFPTPFGCRGHGRGHDVVGTGCHTPFGKWIVTTFDFSSPRSDGHFVLLGVRGHLSPRALQKGAESLRVTALDPVRVADRRYARYRVDYAPGSAQHGHLIFVWQQRGATYSLGFHGFGSRSDHLGRFMLRHSELITEADGE
jgi:hypothetical protein